MQFIYRVWSKIILFYIIQCIMKVCPLYVYLCIIRVVNM